MGYAIAAPMKSRKAQRRMLEFMGREFRPARALVPDLVDEGYDNTVCGPEEGPDIPYDGFKLSLAFHYASWANYDRYYAWTVCMWMALKCGRLNNNKQPYVRYDGHMCFEVSAQEKQSLGVRLSGERGGPVFPHDPNNDRVVRTVFEEIQRLDKAWEEFNQNN